VVLLLGESNTLNNLTSLLFPSNLALKPLRNKEYYALNTLRFKVTQTLIRGKATFYFYEFLVHAA
jgi:hypothetical protein